MKVLTGSHDGKHGVTSALNCTISVEGNLNALNAAVNLPWGPSLISWLMIAGSVGHLISKCKIFRNGGISI